VKTCILVAPHFPPSNLAAVHRTRIWARHLPEFGWKPIILTTHWKHYEEALDWDLHRMLPEGLEVVSTGALPTRPLRMVGDIGIRAFPWHLHAIRRLVRERKIDFLHIPIPSNYSALLGRAARYLTGIPYGIDYIDPWVHEWPGSEVKWSKAWTSCKLARLLEPWAVKHASAITGITRGYYQGVLDRNPHLGKQAVVDFMPYGSEAGDFDLAAGLSLEAPLWEDDGRFHAIYAGAMLPKAVRPLRALLTALSDLKGQRPDLARHFQLHFVGTGSHPSDPLSHQVVPFAQEAGVADLVSEHPHRMPYFRVLAHLRRASGVLVLGSTEPHYSPSKTFQAIQSEKPILALLHEDSTAVGYLRQVGGTLVHTMDEATGPDPRALADGLRFWIAGNIQVPGGRSSSIPHEQTGIASAQVLAATMDRALNRGSK
jgi:hypothetical protein